MAYIMQTNVTFVELCLDYLKISGFAMDMSLTGLSGFTTNWSAVR